MSSLYYNLEIPLVSVVVVTYNSSKTIIETLESIKEQTYDRIELVITDDCSSDDTIALVNKWLEHNSSRFINAVVVTTDKNTGVAGNHKRGIAKTQGVWIKTIAGDDLLIPEAIEEYVRYVGSNDIIQMCVCDVECFSSDGEVSPQSIELYNKYFQYANEPYEKQLDRVMTQLVFVGPTYFYSRKLYNEVGGCPEKYGCAEEWPFVYKVIKAGHRIYAIDKKLVKYRVQSDSISHDKSKDGLISKHLFMGMYSHYFDYPFKDLIRRGKYLTAWHYALYYWGHKLQYNFKSPIIRKVISVLFGIASPLAVINKLKKE